jgi:tRNA nucleotidyltransferase (CCA-adding enzyme)
VRLARGADPVELVLARALGAQWLDRYQAEWRRVALEIDGEELIAAGVPQGPQIGQGLAEALRRKLDGELSGRDEELAVALETARKSG